jgi:hypothetical protein
MSEGRATRAFRRKLRVSGTNQGGEGWRTTWPRQPARWATAVFRAAVTEKSKDWTLCAVSQRGSARRGQINAPAVKGASNAEVR